MKVYFNTPAFDYLPEKSKLDITTTPAEAELAVMGQKTINFPEFTNLKAIYRNGVGRSNIPDELIERGHPKVFFPSEEAKRCLYASTANFTTYLIFHMYYSKTTGNVTSWTKQTRDLLSNKNLLVIGAGNVGIRVVERMKPFLTVDTYDTKHNSEDELKPSIQLADIITLHLPLNEQTQGFIDSEKLSWMKNDTILINTARGAIVDEDALYERLIRTDMKAAFDVFWTEPYSGKLKGLGKSKFFMTPHTSSQTIDYVKAGFKDICAIIKEYEGKQ